MLQVQNRPRNERWRMTLHSNVPWDDLQAGMSAEITHLCRAEDFYVFANSSGNMNPMHLPREDGDGDGTPEAVALPLPVIQLLLQNLPSDQNLFHA